MTNLTKLIERRQGEVEKWKMFPGKEYIDIINYDLYQVEDVKNEVAEVATLAYRQALLDLREGLPGDVEVPELCRNWQSQLAHEKAKSHNTALKTVRAQVEGLLSNKE